MMKKPVFFIVGAPKCGTTALFSYLGAHPGIFMPERKELHYFGSDLQSRMFMRDEKTYLSLFQNAQDGQVPGEASVWYLYSRSAAKEIKTWCAEAKIIIMLRNPVDVLYSQHSQFLFNGNENIEDFEAAINAELDRKNGLRIPRSVHFVESLFYKDTVRFAEQVERYLKEFGRERVHIILYDDFKQDTEKEVRKTLRFLGVAEDIPLRFRMVNPNKKIRSRLLWKMMYEPAPVLLRLWRTIVPVSMRNRIKDTTKRLNSRYQPRSPLEPAVRRRLLDDMASEIEQLGKVIGKDLSHWHV